ncbi:MAG: hypothetical protein HN576_10485 [Bacteriovoracaceae bacterium]|nr:hypothetical protein [Bacteriovoracaceae bacterium]
MKIVISTLIFFIFTTRLIAAPLPNKLRLQIDIGYEIFDYNDEYQFQPYLNQEIKSKNITYRAQGTYFLWAPYLYLEGAGEYSSSQAVSGNEGFYKYEVHARVGLFIPGDYYWFKLVSENYFTSLISTENTYGYKNVENWVVYPMFGLNSHALDSAINFAIYYKYPIFKSSHQTDETLIGLEVRVPLGSDFKYPLYAYQKALFFRLEYRDYQFEYLISGRSLVIKNKSMLLSIGYNF